MRFILLLFVAVSPAYGQAKAVVTGPEKSEVGDFVVLSATDSVGDDFQWKLTNSTKGILTVEDDSRCILLTGNAGVYIFVLSVSQSDADKGSTVDSCIHTVQIGKPDVTPVVPDPVVPDPVVPDPVEPDKPTPPKPKPIPSLEGCAKAMFEVLHRMQPSLVDVRAISNNYKTVAGKAAGLGWSVLQIKQEFQQLNRPLFESDEKKAEWSEWPEAHGKCNNARNNSQQMIQIFDEQAKGFDAYAEWASNGAYTANRSTLIGTVKDLKQKKNDIETEAKKVNDFLQDVESSLQSVKEGIGQ